MKARGKTAMAGGEEEIQDERREWVCFTAVKN